jgi:hypothetical protein
MAAETTIELTEARLAQPSARSAVSAKTADGAMRQEGRDHV